MHPVSKAEAVSAVQRSGPAALTRRGKGGMRRAEALAGMLCVAPWALGFLLFTGGPMLFSLVLSFTRWNLLSPPKWVGLSNFQTLFVKDPLVWHSLLVTTLYAVLAVPLAVALGLLLAVLLNQRIRFLSFFRMLFYLPSVVSGVPVALLWSWIFSPNVGLLDGLLGLVGIRGPAWLFDPHTVIIAFVIMSLWGVGGSMVIYLASLQGIPPHLLEAATIDGASAWRRLVHITVPLLTPIIFFNLVTGIIGALQMFVPAYVMTQGGPNNASLMFMLYLFENAFQYFRMGYASALAWVLFLYVAVLTFLLFRFSGRWVYYEGMLKSDN